METSCRKGFFKIMLQQIRLDHDTNFLLPSEVQLRLFSPLCIKYVFCLINCLVAGTMVRGVSPYMCFCFANYREPAVRALNSRSFLPLEMPALTPFAQKLTLAKKKIMWQMKLSDIKEVRQLATLSNTEPLLSTLWSSLWIYPDNGPLASRSPG